MAMMPQPTPGMNPGYNAPIQAWMPQMGPAVWTGMQNASLSDLNAQQNMAAAAAAATEASNQMVQRSTQEEFFAVMQAGVQQAESAARSVATAAMSNSKAFLSAAAQAA